MPWIGYALPVCCDVLQCVAVCCSVVHCVAVCCSGLQFFTVQCSVVRGGRCVGLNTRCLCVAVCFMRVACGAASRACCSTLYCVALCCSVLQYIIVCCSMSQLSTFVSVEQQLALRNKGVRHTERVRACCSALQCLERVAVCYTVVQCVTLCCSALQYLSVCCKHSPVSVSGSNWLWGRGASSMLMPWRACFISSSSVPHTTQSHLRLYSTLRAVGGSSLFIYI